MDKKVEKKLTEQESSKLNEAIEQVKKLTNAERAVKDNVIEFSFKEEAYRVRMPTIREKIVINSSKLAEKNRLQKAGFKYESILKKELKEIQNVDLEKIDNQIEDIRKELKDFNLRLASEVNEESRETLKDIITSNEKEIERLVVQKNIYLEESIESQLFEFTITQFATIIFEKQVDDKSIDIKEGDKYSKKWERVFKSYDEFIDSGNSILVSTAIYYTQVFLFSGVA